MRGLGLSWNRSGSKDPNREGKKILSQRREKCQAKEEGRRTFFVFRRNAKAHPTTQAFREATVRNRATHDQAKRIEGPMPPIDAAVEKTRATKPNAKAKPKPTRPCVAEVQRFSKMRREPDEMVTFAAPRGLFALRRPCDSPVRNMNARHEGIDSCAKVDTGNNKPAVDNASGRSRKVRPRKAAHPSRRRAPGRRLRPGGDATPRKWATKRRRVVRANPKGERALPHSAAVAS